VSASTTSAPACAADRHHQALLLQLLHQHQEAAARRADHVGRRDPAVLEGQLRGVLRRHAHLLELLALVKAGRAGLDREQRDVLVRAVALLAARRDDAQIAEDAVGDEGLGAVDDVVVAVAAAPWWRSPRGPSPCPARSWRSP
jgi:hypothetical protein